MKPSDLTRCPHHPHPTRKWSARHNILRDSAIPAPWVPEEETASLLGSVIDAFYELRRLKGLPPIKLSRPRLWHHLLCSFERTVNQRKNPPLCCSCEPLVLAWYQNRLVAIYPGDPDFYEITFPVRSDALVLSPDPLALGRGFGHFPQPDGSFRVLDSAGRRVWDRKMSRFEKLRGNDWILDEDVEMPEIDAGKTYRGVFFQTFRAFVNRDHAELARLQGIERYENAITQLTAPRPSDVSEVEWRERNLEAFDQAMSIPLLNDIDAEEPPPEPEPDAEAEIKRDADQLIAEITNWLSSPATRWDAVEALSKVARGASELAPGLWQLLGRSAARSRRRATKTDDAPR